jgi:hypothetical protein
MLGRIASGLRSGVVGPTDATPDLGDMIELINRQFDDVEGV